MAVDEDETSAMGEPLIRFGNEWVPAHEVWNKMETATVIVEAIERFNANFPHLSSADSRDVVPLVRQRLKDISLRMPARDTDQPDLATICIGLLQAMGPEDAVEQLRVIHEVDVSTAQLIQLAGEEAYLSALAREARKFKANGISPEQTAGLWKAAGRPAPGGGLWNTGKVEDLLTTA